MTEIHRCSHWQDDKCICILINGAGSKKSR